MNILINPNAPQIAYTLKKTLTNIQNPNECALGLRLSYQDTNTIFYLDTVTSINFMDNYLEIRQNNNSACYLDYLQIYEYFIMPSADLNIIGEE